MLAVTLTQRSLFESKVLFNINFAPPKKTCGEKENKYSIIACACEMIFF